MCLMVHFLKCELYRRVCLCVCSVWNFILTESINTNTSDVISGCLCFCVLCVLFLEQAGLSQAQLLNVVFTEP